MRNYQLKCMNGIQNKDYLIVHVFLFVYLAQPQITFRNKIKKAILKTAHQSHLLSKLKENEN